jgi:hypothetical protein
MINNTPTSINRKDTKYWYLLTDSNFTSLLPIKAPAKRDGKVIKANKIIFSEIRPLNPKTATCIIPFAKKNPIKICLIIYLSNNSFLV